MIGFLVGVGAWIKMAALAVFEFVLEYPWQAALVAALCLTAWFWHDRNGERADKESALREIAEIMKASEEAGKRALAAKEATEAKYREQANEADTEHKAQLADARSATDDFIARNRVRPQVGSSCSPAPSSTGGGRASVPEAMPADPVLVGSDDVQRCTAATVYAVESFRWAQGFSE